MAQSEVQPTRYTPPLRPDFVSLFDLEYRRGYTYLEVIQRVWRKSYGFELDAWQVDELRRATELVDGHLRYRQYLISMGRQNGKTEMLGALALLFLLARNDSWIVGIASTREQANFVYDKTKDAVGRTPWLGAMFTATGTRGINGLNGSKYRVKPAKDAALQGIPVALGIVDEVHLLPMSLWAAMVNGTGGREDTLVVGITTAGTDNSELLNHLYKLAEAAPDGFGFSIWEAPSDKVPEDDAELAELLRAANPALATGRTSIAEAIKDARTLPEHQIVQFKLNRFTSAVGEFIPAEVWARTADDTWPDAQPLFVIDKTPDWSWANITVVAKQGELTYIDLVRDLHNPTIDTLADHCEELFRHNPITYVVDGYSLKTLGQELEKRGLPVTYMSLGDNKTAAAMFYAKAVQEKLRHSNMTIFRRQLAKAKIENSGDGFRVVRKSKSDQIDTVISMTLGVLAAETIKPLPLQVF
jgi:phage terminase large subunit-like protein